MNKVRSVMHSSQRNASYETVLWMTQIYERALLMSQQFPKGIVRLVITKFTFFRDYPIQYKPGTVTVMYMLL